MSQGRHVAPTPSTAAETQKANVYVVPGGNDAHDVGKCTPT